MEYLIVDSSVLIVKCNFWEYNGTDGKIFIRERKFSECDALFELVKKNKKNIVCVITKTVEIEATNALKKATDSLIKSNRLKLSNVLKAYNYETLKNIIFDRSLDRLEDTIEEYSTRLPLDKTIVEKILIEEIEVFFKKIKPDTVRYFNAPSIIKNMKGSIDGKKDILSEMLESGSFGDKILCLTGEPKEKDKRIMAEATYISRNYSDGKRVYLASLDYHFIPNPIQVESFLSRLSTTDYKHLDNRMRNLLEKNFNFFGDRPKELLVIFSRIGLSFSAVKSG